MNPYQQRVIDEKMALDEKAYTLSRFIRHSHVFTMLRPEEQELLKEQNDAMWQYSEILGKRIAAFWRVAPHTEGTRLDYRKLFEEAAASLGAINEILGIDDDGCGSPIASIERVKHWKGLLLWALFHSQGSSSNVGQPIRSALGIDVHAPLTTEQVSTAREAAVNDV